jgi:hypothetical protein
VATFSLAHVDHGHLMQHRHDDTHSFVCVRNTCCGTSAKQRAQ